MIAIFEDLTFEQLPEYIKLWVKQELDESYNYFLDDLHHKRTMIMSIDGVTYFAYNVFRRTFTVVWLYGENIDYCIKAIAERVRTKTECVEIIAHSKRKGCFKAYEQNGLKYVSNYSIYKLVV